MIWLYAVLHGAIWTVLWIVALLVMSKLLPQTMVHNYPKELQKLAKVPVKNKKLTVPVSLAVWVVLIGYYLFAVIWTLHNVQHDFFAVIAFSFIIFMFWNLFDLLILDWILFCKIQPSFMVLEGTKGHLAYKDYRFHFIGFLKGTLYAAIFAFALGGLSYLFLDLLIW